MSADLFAVFGTPDEVPTRDQLDQRWNVPLPSSPLDAISQAHQPTSNNENALVDADQVETEDEFGEFEDVQATDSPPTPAPAKQQRENVTPALPTLTQQTHLLDLEDEQGLEQQHRRVPSLEATVDVKRTDDADEWGDFEDFGNIEQSEQQPVVRTNIPSVPAPAVDLQLPQNMPSIQSDEWDDFEEWNTVQTTAESATIPTADGGASINSTRPRLEMPDEPHPVNIPPPTILLQLLPQVFESIHDQAQVSHEAPEMEETAASIVTVFAVSARIIAGRSLRWKRDTYLAQSTRIGPSTAGARSGGMKLTAVNKSEAIREEREAADVCDAWSRNTHVFAGIVSRSEHRRPWMNLNVKMTARPSPGFGTLEAREPCALCGIKRDERIAGVDFDTDDVFAEYWTEHWGHTDCKIFWYTYREMLDHR